MAHAVVGTDRNRRPGIGERTERDVERPHEVIRRRTVRRMLVPHDVGERQGVRAGDARHHPVGAGREPDAFEPREIRCEPVAHRALEVLRIAAIDAHHPHRSAWPAVLDAVDPDGPGHRAPCGVGQSAH